VSQITQQSMWSRTEFTHRSITSDSSRTIIARQIDGLSVLELVIGGAGRRSARPGRSV
jgi:hypothetical protein